MTPMHQDNPDFVERRQPERAVIVLINNLQQSVDALNEKFDTLAVTREELVDRLLAEAFPEGDHEAHRKYHETLIKAAEDRAAMWRDLRSSVAKWGVLGLLAWLTHQVWLGVLAGPK